MAEIPGGVRFTGFVAPSDDTDTYAVIDPKYGIDGHRSVSDITERDNITTDRRREGMTVYVQSEHAIYRLVGGINNSDWVIETGATVYQGDIEYYVETTGSDSTGDGSNTNPYATIEKALEMVPTYVTGKIYIYVGSGSFDLDIDKFNLLVDKIQHTTYLYISGFITSVDSDVTFTQDATINSKYSISNQTTGIDYTDKWIIPGLYDHPIPTIDYDSNNQTISVAYDSPSFTGDMFSLDTTINLISSLNTVSIIGCNYPFMLQNFNIVSTKKVKLGSNDFIRSGKLFSNSIDAYNVNLKNFELRHAFIKSNVDNNSKFGVLLVDKYIEPKFRSSIVVNNSDNNKIGNGIEYRDGSIFNVLVRNFNNGIIYKPTSEPLNRDIDEVPESTHYDVGWLHIDNVNNVIRIESPSVAMIDTDNVPHGLIATNYDYLLSIASNRELQNMTMLISDVAGDIPNIDYCDINDYHLLDEQVVNKVVLPDRKSKPLLELTTTERDNYSIPYEGQIIKNIDNNKLEVYRDGSWILFAGNLQEIFDNSISQTGEVYGDSGASFFEDDSNSTILHAKTGGYEFNIGEEGENSFLSFKSESSTGADDAEIKLVDGRATHKGIEYDADYSNNFTNRSLVDKEYVDNSISTSDTNIYNTDGSLTSDRTVTGDAYNLSLINLGGFNIEVIDDTDYATIDISIDELNVSLSNSNYYSGHYITPEQSYIYSDDGTNRSIIRTSQNEMNIIDNINNKGLVYDADYSSNFTNRSLVDKEYVDNSISTSDTNMYNTDGSLTSDRTVTMNNNLTFTGSGRLLIGGGATEPASLTVNGNSNHDFIVSYRDLDGESIFRTGGSLSNDDFVLYIGDVEGAYSDSKVSYNFKDSGSFFSLFNAQLRFYKDNSNDYISLDIPSSISGQTNLVLPSSIGINGQKLTTDGNGNMSWENSPTVTSGTTAPTTTPNAIGDIYVDTTTPKMYMAKGNTNSSDWVALN